MPNEIEGEIVLYQPDENIKIEVKVDSNQDTVWLTKKQMAELFGRDRTTISRHISNTFEQGEVDAKVGCAFFAQTTRHGAIEGKTQTDDIEFYNLDVIISVGYRVHSPQGVLFRKWATNILKQYLLKGYAINQQLLSMQRQIDSRLDLQSERMFLLEQRQNQQQQQLDFFIRTSTPPAEMVFFKLKKESHDRWLIIDNRLYHCGHSLNAIGNKMSAITLMGKSPDEILDEVR